MAEISNIMRHYKKQSYFQKDNTRNYRLPSAMGPKIRNLALLGVKFLE